MQACANDKFVKISYFLYCRLFLLLSFLDQTWKKYKAQNSKISINKDTFWYLKQEDHYGSVSLSGFHIFTCQGVFFFNFVWTTELIYRSSLSVMANRIVTSRMIKYFQNVFAILRKITGPLNASHSNLQVFMRLSVFKTGQPS